jgi:hypothetical protein
LQLRCLPSASFIGTYSARRAPVWSAFYGENWIVRQSLRLVPWRLMEGTGVPACALRALGARIGQRVHIHRGVDCCRAAGTCSTSATT